MNVSIVNLIIIIAVTVCITLAFIERTRLSFRLCVSVFVVSFFIYCGSGLSFGQELFNEYICKYIIYLMAFLCSMKIISANTNGAQFININYAAIRLLVNCGAYCYVALLFVNLLYPDFKLHLLFMPPKISAANIFFYAMRNQENILLKLTTTLLHTLFPVFLIYLNILLINGKRMKAIGIFILTIYIDYVSREYISRNEILRHIFFIIAMLFVVKRNGIVITKKLIITCMFLIFAMIPIFLGMQSYRLGGSFTTYSYTDALLKLWNLEADYSKYFAMLQEPLIKIGDYILWLICLPIPSILWSSKPAVFVNTVFTEHILGLLPGEPGYTVILPSLLGESFMVFGMKLYWLQAILCGAVYAYLFKSLCSNRYLQLNFFYFLLLCLFIGRGGTASCLPPLINGVVSIVIFCCFSKVIYKNRSIKESWNE